MRNVDSSAYTQVPAALDQWAKWALDTNTAFCAGFPKRSIVAAIADLHLSEYTEVPAKPGVCPYCRQDEKGGKPKTVADLPTHIRSRHPELHRYTAQGRQTRSVSYYSPEDHPLAEAVEAAVVFIGKTRPELYHVVLADRLWIVPKFKSGWDQQRMTSFDHYVYMPQHVWSGESEAQHKARIAFRMGMSLAKFYRLREQAFTALGVFLDLNRRYNIVEA